MGGCAINGYGLGTVPSTSGWWFHLEGLLQPRWFCDYAPTLNYKPMYAVAVIVPFRCFGTMYMQKHNIPNVPAYRPSLKHPRLTCWHLKGEHALIIHMAVHGNSRMSLLDYFHMLISDSNILSSRCLVIFSRWKIMLLYRTVMLLANKSFTLQTIWDFFHSHMTSSIILREEFQFYQ